MSLSLEITHFAKITILTKYPFNSFYQETKKIKFLPVLLCSEINFFAMSQSLVECRPLRIYSFSKGFLFLPSLQGALFEAFILKH